MLTGELDLNRLNDRFRRVDRFILDILSVRLASGGLSDYVAENKRKSSPDGIFNKRRQEKEDDRIDNMKTWAKAIGMDPNFAASLMYQIISESCRAQDEIMIRKYREKQNTVNEENKEDVYAYQRQELIKLVSKVAAVYDKEYAKGFFGTKVYNEYEKEILDEVMDGLSDRKLAIDLGCATGIISFEIAPQFKEVIGYDISPEMIEIAESKISDSFSHVEFVNIDIEDGLNLPDNSVSLAVMNMGTASDIRNIEGVIKEL
ncbi:class I SAM-dependent methyltransferase, partial [Patescibacteria group bacterium]|nr:class I SAM-dependent methyltransferase [Patescibacteria group bacterium]